MSHQVDLASAWAKFRHAERHLADLNQSIQSFFAEESNRPRLSADLDHASGFHVLKIKSAPDLAPFVEEVGLALGDIVHDLRSALDHSAWQLACRFAGGAPTNPREVYFPICDPPAGKRHKNPSYLDPADWQSLHEFQPCKGLNGRPDSWSSAYVHQLALLQKMSNEDKHQALTVVLLVPNAFSTIPTHVGPPPWIVKTETGWEFVPERVSDPDQGAEQMRFDQAGTRVELGTEVARIKAPAWQGLSRIDDVGEVTPHVALAELRPAVPTMTRLANFVRLILESV